MYTLIRKSYDLRGQNFPCKFFFLKLPPANFYYYLPYFADVADKKSSFVLTRPLTFCLPHQQKEGKSKK
jgi:hypothetical protein